MVTLESLAGKQMSSQFIVLNKGTAPIRPKIYSKEAYLTKSLLGNIKQTGLKLHKVSAAGLAAVG